MPRKTSSRTCGRGRGRLPRFNEAAARCRGKPARSTPPPARSAPRFNEAAARCRGKRPHRGRGVGKRRASMRPRPDAAENADVAAGAVRRGIASMRPRPDAAENLIGLNLTSWGSGIASMRPRPDAAENVRRRWVRMTPAAGFNEAAARCRGKRPLRPGAAVGSRGFNEAAARCRGKRHRAEQWDDDPAGASMRPRPDAAENPSMPSGLSWIECPLQ